MELNGLIDMHAHTTASDGQLTPSELVAYAKKKQLKAVAITDHDTFAGVAEAQAAGKQLSITVIPGIEISTVADAHDIHVLGYFTNNEDLIWQQRIAELGSSRNNRNKAIINKLNELGINITLQEVEAVVQASNQSIGRPHIAEVLIQKGIVQSKSEAFEKFLGSQGLAYVEPKRIHPLDAFAWIREAGGLCVLAHPGLYNNQKLVEELLAAKPDGVEVYHADHTPEDKQWLQALAEKYELCVTGGSDFHGISGNKSEVHGDLGSVVIPYSYLENLLSRLKS